MTRTGPVYRGGNIARAQFCNRRHAALMLRIHADGSASAASNGISTLYPAWHRGWTDDISGAEPARRAGGAAGAGALDGSARPRHRPRSDLTGFNWANVPAILVETGFLSNPREWRLLHTDAYRRRVAAGLVAGVEAFVRP